MSGRPGGIAALLLAGVLTLAGCGGSAQGSADGPAEVVHVETPTDGGPGVVTLAEAAAKRLDIRTATVESGPHGLVLPYSALVYQPDGSAWVYVQTQRLTYQRAPVAVIDISGDEVTAGSGPPPGTPVVDQGAAELVGAETGIDGEE